MRKKEKYKLNNISRFKDCLYYTILIACQEMNIDKFKSCAALLYPYDGIAISRKLPLFPELLKADGIKLLIRHCNNNLVSSIIEDINNNKPVIVGVDIFYDPMCKITFGKFHSEHFLVISEYNSATEVFRVVEHDYVNENTYQYRDMSFKELEMCFSGRGFAFEKTEPIKCRQLCEDYAMATEEMMSLLSVIPAGKMFQKQVDKIIDMQSALTCLYVEQLGYESILTEYVAHVEMAWKAVKESYTKENVEKVLECNKNLCFKMAELLK